MKNLKGLRISVCQMNIMPGRPDLNGKYITNEILAAAGRGIDIIVFPEMCVTGYLIGDLWEDEFFVKDVQFFNEQIREATRAGIVSIFGSVTMRRDQKGEDGRIRKFNTALIAQNGQWVGSNFKSLHPNYRVFDDDRYFYSTRKIADENGEPGINNFLQPFVLKTKIGEIMAGAILCEDMWCQDYPFNPTKGLVENGAEIIFNLSASPWTWQKNRKRHQVVKDLLSECQVPFVYVNNTGVQNSGKNIIIFDGSSTVYNQAGEIIFEVEPYESGSHDFEFKENTPIVVLWSQNDALELYSALQCGIKGFFETLPPPMRKVVIGLSGGIDSALLAGLYVDILGAENVVAINMPSKFNSEQAKNIARKIAENLGIQYEIQPIQKIVDAIAETTDTLEDSLSYENIQARVRMEILAARAQNLACVFSANWNKVEAGFGYGTLYGDMAGSVAVLGDLIKYEVYQLADFLNRTVFKKEAIPAACFEIQPSAELRKNQRDPFDYGNLKKRGYHDEMIRSFTEFRRNPEWFLEKYAQGKLEGELKLEPGTLIGLFTTPRDFIKDLEKNWKRFFGSYFKRVQGAPIPIVSKRAFGTDLRESILSAHFTQRYWDLKKLIIARCPPQERIAIFGGSFNPPHNAHRQIVEALINRFDRVFIIPCGMRRDKPSANILAAGLRKKMIKLVFANLPNVKIDFHDLDQNIFTSTYLLQECYANLFPGAQIWHVVGEDIIAGGRNKNSEIHKVWEYGSDIWNDLNFLVLNRSGYGAKLEDMPPSSEIMEVREIIGSGTLIRQRIKNGESIDDLVDLKVKEFIKKNKLYIE